MIRKTQRGHAVGREGFEALAEEQTAFNLTLFFLRSYSISVKYPFKRTERENKYTRSAFSLSWTSLAFPGKN